MGDAVTAFNNFWKNPLGNRSAGDYFLFVGLVLLIVIVWTRILKFITEV